MDGANDRTDLWSEILRGADRSAGTRGRGSWKRKNIILLSERHHGRKHLLEQLASTSTSTSSKKKAGKAKNRFIGEPLALGYEALEIREDGDEDSAPPVSIFYPPSSHPMLLGLVPGSLPPKSFQDTAVMIVLDWTKPSSMVGELLTWLKWVDDWAKDAAGRGEAEEMRERLQSHLQHYSEPHASAPGSTSLPSITSAYGGGPLLPLGPGTLTLNPSGIPIVVVCTKADLMDTVGDEMGMKAGGWEERTDWVQQALRTICLAYGAALFYTATSQPSTYTLLRQYLLHRLHTIPPPLNPPPSTTSAIPPGPERARFPFRHRANVLDRDAVMVPSGWDSWGKINVLRDGFDPGRVGKAWEVGLRRVGIDEDEDGEEGIDDLWIAMIPDTERGSKTRAIPAVTTTTEPEQSFLAKQLEILQKDPQRDPRASFRNTSAALTASASSTTASGDLGGGGGVVGPMGSAGGGLSLPGVEKAMAEMEGGTAEELKEKFARLGMNRRESARGGSGPLSPTTPGATGSSSAVPNEALHNFFQGLLATKAKSSSTTPTSQSSTKTSMPPPPVPNRSASSGASEAH